MYFNLKMLLASVCFLAAAYKIQAATQPLQCWHCSTDTVGSEDFCGITFKEDNIPPELKKDHNINVYRSCNSTIHSEHERPVCRKTIEENGEKTITKRFCYYTNKSDPLDHCNTEPTDKKARRIFCEDCLDNFCNGANSPSRYIGTIIVGMTAFLGLGVNALVF